MLKVRIIPCLDVKDGRVVKGVQFVGLRDAGDPVEQARATAALHILLAGVINNPRRGREVHHDNPHTRYTHEGLISLRS